MTMDLTIQKQDLSKMLEIARGAFSAKSPMEILKCVLLEADDGRLTISATDNFISARTSSDAAVKTGGRVCVDARSFADIAKDLPEGEVRIQVAKEAFTITAKKSKRKLATVFEGSFPALPSVEQATKLATVEGNTLARLILQGSYAQCTDDSRPHLAGALLELKDDVASLVSTDGSRLAKATARASHGTASRHVIPPRGLSEVKGMCAAHKGGTIDLYRLNALLMLSAGSTVISVQLGDDDIYPPYAKVIPTSCERSVTLHRETLASAVKRAGLVSKNVKGGGVRFEFARGELAIKCEHESDAADERVECDAEFEFTIGAGAGNVLAALSALTGDEVLLQMGSDLHPMVFTSPGDDECMSLVMPMRL